MSPTEAGTPLVEQVAEAVRRAAYEWSLRHGPYDHVEVMPHTRPSAYGCDFDITVWQQGDGSPITITFTAEED